MSAAQKYGVANLVHYIQRWATSRVSCKALSFEGDVAMWKTSPA